MPEKCEVSGIRAGSCAGDGAGGTLGGAGGARRCGQKGWQPLSEGGSEWMSQRGLCPVAPARAGLSLAHCFGQGHQMS